MQNVSGQLYQILLSSQRDLAPVDCFEFYSPDVVDLIPANAERRFASTTFVWYGWEYEQQAISRGDISRYMTEKFNSVNVTLSNVDRRVSDWLAGIDLEGYRLVIRAVSRSVNEDSLTLFVGRCEKPGDIDNAQVVITAKQDLGTIENELPFAKYELKCPLKFRGTECLAGQQLTDKTQTYRTATECNKSFSQCFEYGNHKAFQGFRYRAVVGSFRVNSRPTGITSIFGSRKATKQWTSTDNVPIGQSIPIGLGRTQIDLMPVLYADTGQYLYGHFIAGEGPITQFADVRNTTAGWATTFQTKYEHLGNYGYNADQETDSQFLGSEYYSHRAYVEATIEGNNPDTGDPAPTLAGLVLWNKIPTIGSTGFDAEDWSDNPVEHVRHLLTEPRALGYQESWIDDNVSLETAQYCNEPVTDTSGCEEFWYDQTQGTAGTDWKRYRSTGVLDSVYYKYLLNPIDANRPQKLGAEYNAYDPENPPEGIVPQTFYRKRYTSNWHLKEPIKVSDFLFKHLLPSFRGYLVTGADGKLQIKSERPAISSYLRNATSPSDTTVAIEDATQWQRLQLNQLYVLIGAGQETSETRRVERIEFSSAGNSLTLAVTQGATPYAATFQGGSSSSQAWNYFTVDDAEAGVPVIVTVDGTTITGGGYDAQGNLPSNGAVAGELAARINANETLNRYIEAIWSKSNPTIVTLRSKLGFLILDRGLTYSHSTEEKLVHVHGVFADAAFGALEQSNILKDTFRWPLGSRQTSYNQFSITYTDSTQDFQQTELRENDYDHQERVNKVNKLEISGACVDNYHQADRLVQAARYKYRDGDFFCSFQAVGDALLLEEGDIIAVNHANMPGRRNQLFRIEELRVSQDHRVLITARLYAEEQFPSAAKVRTVGLNTGTVWIAGAPPQVSGVSVSYTTIDSGRVEFDFGAFVGGQTARIEIKRPGDSDWLPVLDAVPDGLGRGAAEIPALKVNTQIRITPISSTGVEGTPTTITVTNPLYQWPTSYPAANGYVLSSTTGGVLSWVEGGGAGVTDGDKGDIAVSGGGATWTIDNDVVSYAKMQNVSAASRLLGRGDSGSGDPQEISLGTGLSMSGTTLSASGAGLTNDSRSITADFTASVNTRYFLTIGSMGANRNFTLPTPAIGDRIEVSILDGNSTNELIIKGASGVKINKGTAATEWSRLFIANETVTFVADTADNWQVLVDGRIPCIGIANDYGDLRGTISSIDTLNSRATITAHGLSTGDPVFISTLNGGTIPAGLEANAFNSTSTTWYAIKFDNDKISFASSYANAIANTKVSLTNSTHTGAEVRRSQLYAPSTFKRVRFTGRNIIQNRGNVLQSTDKGVARRGGVYQLFFICQMSDLADLSTIGNGAHQACIAANDMDGLSGFPDGAYTVANLFGNGRRVSQAQTTVTLSSGAAIYWGSRQQTASLTESLQHAVQRPTVSMVEIL